MVVKEQEEADAYELDALVRAGAGYAPGDAQPRNWQQIVAYFGSDGSTETKRDPSWYRRGGASSASELAVDVDGLLWEQTGTNSWVCIPSGSIRSAVPDGWIHLRVPAGECYVDAVKARVLVPTLVWYDSVTGEFSTLGPASGSQFVGGADGSIVYPDGLSSLISTPQEYVSARLTIAAGGLGTSEEVALRAAISSFEAVGPWEDVRQPLFLRDPSGNIVFGDDGRPMVNPLRVVDVAYRGELNGYYRRLVRDGNIDPFVARTAEQFEILEWGQMSPALPRETYQRYVGLHSVSAKVFKSAFYNEALEGDPLYYNYCRLFIAWMAVLRTVDDRISGVGNVDRMTDYEITNLLYSFGIYQFDDIPLAYRRRLAKNLEGLIGNKGTPQVFLDILSLFGLNRDVRIWTHYLVKYFPNRTVVASLPRDPTPDEVVELALTDGTVFRSTRGNTGWATEAAVALSQSAAVTRIGPTGDGRGLIALLKEQETKIAISWLAFLDADSLLTNELGAVTPGAVDFGSPEVGFQKADIDDQLAESTIANVDISYIRDYDEFVSADATWETTRQEARDTAFSILQTKYFSLSAALDAVGNGMAMAILWSTLKDATVRGRDGALAVSGSVGIGVSSMNLLEALVAALTVLLWRFGVDDIIPHGESGVATVLAARTDGVAFPGEVSLLPFSTTLARVAEQPDPLVPRNIVEVLKRNIDVATKIDGADSVIGRVAGPADPLRGGEESTAEAWHGEVRRLWDHKFVARYQTEAFAGAERYSEWLDRSNPELGAWVRSVDATGGHERGLIDIVVLLEDALEGTDLVDLSTVLGSFDIMKVYVERMVRFFKAYTTDLHDFSTFFLVDRPAVESLRLMNLLSGVEASWTRDDLPLGLLEVHDWLIEWSRSEEGVWLEEARGILGKLGKQEIVEILERVGRVRTAWLRVSPAAGWRDTIAIRAGVPRRDSLCIRTRGLGRPGRGGHGLDDHLVKITEH
jgi:hypothetical protein